MPGSDDVSITLGESLETDVVDFLRTALFEFNHSRVGDDSHKNLFIHLRDSENRIVGGLIGGTYYGYLHVDVLWVDEGRRGQGFGARMMEIAEQEAIKRGCLYAHLDTHGFQALNFYQKRGYTIVGELKDLPPGDRRYLLRKILKS